MQRLGCLLTASEEAAALCDITASYLSEVIRQVRTLLSAHMQHDWHWICRSQLSDTLMANMQHTNENSGSNLYL